MKKNLQNDAALKSYAGKRAAKVAEQLHSAHRNSFSQFESTVRLHSGGTEAREWVGGKKNIYI